MIRLFYYKIKLLSPLFFRTRQDSGAAGATTTDPWIGDLAIAYAINSSLGSYRVPFKYNSSKPDYSEVLRFPFMLSVAFPVSDIRYTRVYDTATSFISQGYYNKRAFDKTGNAPMRNWLKRQGIAPGNEFIFAMAVSEDWDPPLEFTIRLGNMKETLASCHMIDKIDGGLTINLFTMILFLNSKGRNYKIDEVAKNLSSSGEDFQSMMEYVMPQYILLRNASPDKWLSYLEGFC